MFESGASRAVRLGEIRQEMRVYRLEDFQRPLLCREIADFQWQADIVVHNVERGGEDKVDTLHHSSRAMSEVVKKRIPRLPIAFFKKPYERLDDSLVHIQERFHNDTAFDNFL